MASAVILLAAASCEYLDNNPDKHAGKTDSTYVDLDDVAKLLASIPMEASHLGEVYDAVSSSSGNGYDEEYTMRDLFERPGSGVGDVSTKTGEAYERPLRDLIKEQLMNSAMTKSENIDPDRFLAELMSSDIQIYWPYSETWDNSKMPIITFDPEDGSEKNIGYRLVQDDDGLRRVEKVLVDEDVAKVDPVWVINRNSDAGYATLEMLRREDPEWGEGGGTIIVRPSAVDMLERTKASGPVKALVLKNFTMNRNYDPWFAGASEFFVKTGYIEDLTARTEAELRLYDPMVTDFMIVVKRSQMGLPQDFNAILMSDWAQWSIDSDGNKEGIDWFAFMITEDDGGTRTEWTTKAKVYVESKSYGFEITLPLNSRDDVVWRGRLSSRWLEANDDLEASFGDVDLTFEVVEY